MNPTPPKKITNCDQSVPHESSKSKWAPKYLDGQCSPLQSSVIVHDLIWCCWICLIDIFSMVAVMLSKLFLKGFIFPRSSFFSPYSLLSLYCKLVLVYFFFTLKRLAYDTRDSWLVNYRYHLWLFKMLYFSRGLLVFVVEAHQKH